MKDGNAGKKEISLECRFTWLDAPILDGTVNPYDIEAELIYKCMYRQYVERKYKDERGDNTNKGKQV